ncbi:MAG: cation transporter [Clostridia bacterium]|nr:cation transporter [Clostridia bacterium]
MKSERKIFIAFILNLAFSIFEFFGGVITGSVAISSDAVHDLGDALSIGISYLLEKKSKKKPDGTYTYGYARFSVLGGLFTSLVLLLGSVGVILNAGYKLLHPAEIDYSGMIVFAIIGASVNLAAAVLTHSGKSINQKAVNLHMLEDVFGWLVVLIGAVVMRFTDFYWLDPLLSIAVAVYILIHAYRTLRQILWLFLEKTPDGISVKELTEHMQMIPGVLDVHHVHVRSVDGSCHAASMHIVTEAEPAEIKRLVRRELAEHGIEHVTLELESPEEGCFEKECDIRASAAPMHHHHHH